MKRNRILPLLLCVFLLAGCNAQPGDSPSGDPPEPNPVSADEPASSAFSEEESEADGSSLEDAVIAAVLEENRGKYLEGEYQGAGCKIFETFPDGDSLSVYALIEYIEYGFEDDRFVNRSGTRAKVLLQFQTEGGGEYHLTGYTCLNPTSGLSDEELEELMLPLKETGKDYLFTDDDLAELRARVDQSAAEYLRSIGRDAEVGEQDPHQSDSLSALGVPFEVWERLLKNGVSYLYPNWNGSLERLENSVRYIYRTEYDEVSQRITCTKTEYDSGTVIQTLVFDGATGEPIE